jgi:tRNA-specific 2-thiouridylase
MTGHFAWIKKEDGKGALFKGLDTHKDQSYFLHQIPQDDLLKIKFPLGSLKKDEVKKIAFDASLNDIVQPESQEICFVKEDYRSFLKASGVIFEQGDIVSVDGKILGTHNGIHNFTIGQRSGLGISDATPYYVLRLDPSGNRVIVGKEKDLLRDELLVEGVNWLCDQDSAFASPCTVKIRYRHKGAMARLYPLDDSIVRVKFDKPQRAVTPGQFAVFYEDARVLGGGSICA